jgi:CDP-diglyceride synthetase
MYVNIYDGMIWFVVSTGLVIFNDVAAYVRRIHKCAAVTRSLSRRSVDAPWEERPSFHSLPKRSISFASSLGVACLLLSKPSVCFAQTWEGFIGALLLTIIFSVLLTSSLLYFGTYFICKQVKLLCRVTETLVSRD